MKVIVFALAAAALFALALPAFADQQVVDTVYLKDGSILKGTIKSLTDESLRIVTTAGLDLTIGMDTVDRFERGSSTNTPAASAGPDAAPLAPSAIEVNLLGLLQFGPYVRYHIQVAPNVFISPHIRVGYLGALNYVLWGGGGIGAGASVLWFFPTPGPNRLYAGSFTEAGIDNETDFILVIGTNVGYRWRFPNGSYWNTGAIAGVSYDFWDELWIFAGMLELSWGREL
jgi:hypothetical protein